MAQHKRKMSIFASTKVWLHIVVIQLLKQSAMAYFSIFGKRKTPEENVDERKEQEKERKKKYEEEKRSRNYNEGWKKRFPWHGLEVNQDGQEVLFCVPCRAQAAKRKSTIGKAKETMVKGSTQMKTYTLTRHEATDAHKICLEREQALLTPAHTSQAGLALTSVNSSAHKCNMNR